MSFQSTIPCPDCGGAIHFDSQLLSSGHKFACSTESCGARISLHTHEKPVVEHAFTKFEALKNDAVQASQKYQDL